MQKLKKIVKVYYEFYCHGCKINHTYSIDDNGWHFNGDIENPSFTPSLLNQTPILSNEIIDGKIVEKMKMINRCHLFVTNGKIHYCSDCDHEFAGKTMPMQLIP